MIEELKSDTCEKAVLGCLLLEPKKFGVAKQFLEASDFYSQQHQDIFDAFHHFFKIGAEADLTLLVDRFESLNIKYDLQYIDSLTEEITYVYNLRNYCKAVKEASLKRKYERVLREGLEALQDPEKMKEMLCKDYISQSMKGMLEIDYVKDDKFTMSEALDMFKEEYDKEKQLVSLGFPMLDELCNGGLPRHGLFLLCSDSGTGKTTFSCNQVINKAMKGEKVLYINLEIPVIDLLEIMIPQLSDLELSVEYKEMITCSPEHKERILEVIDKRMSELNIHFARGCYTIEEIIAQIDLHRLDYSIDSVFIDHAQLITNASDYQKNVEITKQLKQYPLKHELPIFVLNQTNDNKDKRADKEPRKTDVRGGGNLYQDADIVIFLYKLDPADKEVYVKLAKNRKGTTGAAHYMQVIFDSKHRSCDLELMDEKPAKPEEEIKGKKKRRGTPTYEERPKDDDY